MAQLKGDVPILHVPGLAQALPECGEIGCVLDRATGCQIANPVQPRRLWPWAARDAATGHQADPSHGHGAAQEIAAAYDAKASHWITSVDWVRMDCGIVSPRACAVLRLTTKSYLAG